MIHRDIILQQTQSLIERVTKQHACREKGIPGTGSLSELRYILNELTKLEGDLTQGIIIPKNQRRLSSSWIVTDSWQHGDPLGEEICRLDYLYQTELEEDD